MNNYVQRTRCIDRTWWHDPEIGLEDAHPPTRPVAIPSAREMAGVKPRKLLAEVCALSFG